MRGDPRVLSIMRSPELVSHSDSCLPFGFSRPPSRSFFQSIPNRETSILAKRSRTSPARGSERSHGKQGQSETSLPRHYRFRAFPRLLARHRLLLTFRLYPGGSRSHEAARTVFLQGSSSSFPRFWIGTATDGLGSRKDGGRIGGRTKEARRKDATTLRGTGTGVYRHSELQSVCH